MAMASTDRDEDGGDPVGEPLHRRRATALRLVDQADDLRQRRVGADPGRLDDEPAVGVDGGADDLVAELSLSTGTGSPVSIDSSTADRPSTTTPSVATFSPGTDDEAHADGEVVDRDLGAVLERGGLRAQLGQGADGLAAAALGPGLEPLARAGSA